MLPSSISSPIPARLGSLVWRSLLLVLLLLLVAQTPLFAQGSGPSPAATMNTVKTFAVVFLRGLMAIGLIIALLKVAKNFLSGSPESFSSFLWLVGGLVIFFGWGFFFRSTLGTWSAPTPAVGNIGNSNLNQAVSSGAYQMAQGVLDTMLTTVVPLLLFTTICLTVVRGFISSGSVQFELGPIFRVMFLYIGLLSYNVLVPQVGNLIGGVAQLIKQNAGSGSTSAYTVLLQLKQAASTQPSAPPTTPGDAGSGTQDGTSIITSLGDKIATSFTSLTDMLTPQKFLMGLATDFMTSIIQAIMEFIQSFLLAFLYVSGPIAIAFSFIPGFGGVAKSWLQSLIGIHMWSIAFQIIAGLFVYYSAHEAAISASSGAAQLANLTGIAQTKYAVACIVFILMYIMVPYMSSLIVGSSAADSFVGSAMRIAASAASGGAAAAPMAASAATNAAGAVSNAAGAVSSGARAAREAAATPGATLGSQAVAFARGAFGGGGGSSSGGDGASVAPPPQMAGAGTEAAQTSTVRSTAPQGPAPTMASPSASPQYAASAGSAMSAQSVATAAGPNGGQTPAAAAATAAPAAPATAAPAPAPSMSAVASAPTAPTIQQSVAGSSTPAAGGAAGGSAGGFSGGATAAMRAAAPPIAIDPNQKPPTLPGATS